MSMPAAIRPWPGSWKTFLSAQKPSLPMSVRPMPAQLTWKTPIRFIANCSAGILLLLITDNCPG